MQQTKFDRWLKECFIYETHILTMRLPEDRLPRRVKVSPVEQGKTGDYKYRLISKSRKLADRLILQLKDDHLMYATHIVEGKHWYNSMLAPDGQSFTYRWVFRCIGVVSLFYLCWGAYILWQDASFITLIKETLKDLQGGGSE